MRKKTHLTPDDRTRIETLLHEDHSLRYIADRLDKAPSTISREIRGHTTIIRPKQCDCLYHDSCSRLHVCGASGCKKKCKTCPKAKKYCPDYVQAQCDTMLEHPLHLCNSCPTRGLCHYERHIYDARAAEKAYRETLVGSRSGFDLSAQELIRIDDIVSPLIKKGQSVYHIVRTNKSALSVSESTVRRLVGASELTVRNIDLPEAVKRKPRKKPQTHPAPSASKEGHLYADYLAYITQNDVPTIQMDCVEGTQADHGAILSLHFVAFHMQLYFILPEHAAHCVVNTLDMIEISLGKDLFSSCIPLILTDNGHEFSDIEGMERSIYGGKRTSVFFCEPNRSDEKGACENNHKQLRKVIPKGTSVDSFSQADMVLLTNHVNSHVRRSLFGRCPYEIAMRTMPEDFFTLLGLERVLPNEVILTPGLLSKKAGLSE